MGFRTKLTAYFVLLSLLPVGAAFWGFSSLAGNNETRQVDAQIETELRRALTTYQAQLDTTQATASRFAGRPDLQRLLERRNRDGLARLLVNHPNVEIVLPGGIRVGAPPPALSARRSARVLVKRGLVGTVVAYLPTDAQLAERLRAGSGFQLGDAIAFLHFSQITESAPPIEGRVSLTAGVLGSTTVGGVGYRVLVANTADGFAGERIAVLSPQSLIDTTNGSTRLRLLELLLTLLLVIAVASYLEGRAIVRTLQALVGAVNGIARGKLDERVPVKGRDELAQLGRAFNEMADQLETRLDELVKERARLSSAIEQIGATLAATHDPDQLLRVVLEVAVEAAGATSAELTNERGEIVRVGQPDEADELLELPLVTGQTSFGTLTLRGPEFSTEQRRVANSLAAQAVVALENARLHSIVERQALVDGLTGLANRRQIEETLTLELARAKRFGIPFSIVIADLDDFKTINDRHGHAVGDLVLREFADLVRHTLREIDLAGRWGGEEFLLLLPSTDATGAAELAERIRTAIDSQAIHAPDGIPFKTTASFGVASYPAAGTAEELFTVADQALYRAKTLGKNRVERNERS